MAINNPPFPITAMVNAALASTVLQAIGITLQSQMYYGQTAPGTLVFVPSASNLPALVIESSTPGGGSRDGFNSGTGAGTTKYRGGIDLIIYLSTTDYGTLETYAWNLIDDLIGQGGVNLNIMDVQIIAVMLPDQGLETGATAGQPGMPQAAFCTIELHIDWAD